MNEEYIRKMEARLHVLEGCVEKMQEILDKNQFRLEDSYWEDVDKGLPSEDSVDNIYGKRCIDKQASRDVLKKGRATGLLTKRKTFDTDKLNRARSAVAVSHPSEPAPSLCSMRYRNNWMYQVLWLIVYVGSIIISCYYIKNAYDNWQSSPVVQATSNNQVHFQNISFPAVTICWPDRLNRDYDFFKNIKDCLECEEHVCQSKGSCNNTELTTLALAHVICERFNSENPLPKSLWTEGNLRRTIGEESFKRNVDKLFPSCETDAIITRMSLGVEPLRLFTRCDHDVYQQLYSSHNNRLCMTFNGLRHKDILESHVVTTLPLSTYVTNNSSYSSTMWSFDNMMGFSGDLNTLPIYGLDGFLILFYQRKKRYEQICSIKDDNLASIIVHSPNEIPMDFDSANEYIISDKKTVEILLSPKITLAREDLAQYPPQQRNCFFAHERKLTMFKFYTKNNCDLQCLVDAYLNSCDCVPFEYPRQNRSVKVCLDFCPRPRYRCECLPDCNSLRYDITTQESPISRFVLSNVTIRSAVEVRFKGNEYYTSVRYSITSYAEFLAYSLGVLGAFLGLSVTCLWQSLYFGAVRLWKYFRLVYKQTVSPVPEF